MTSFIELANKAYNILNCEKKQYRKQKSFIHSFFKGQDEINDSVIRMRFILIDYYYSTQMNKRYYGIDDIIDNIKKSYQGINSEIDKEMAKDYLELEMTNNFESRIGKLFNMPFGIMKSGKDKGLAVSLLSKYGYFLTGFGFPIYDSLAKSGIKEKKLFNRNERGISNFANFLPVIKKINKESKINDYDKLDCLLWLYGKMYGNKKEERGLGLLFNNKEEYKKSKDNLPEDLKEFERLVENRKKGN